MMSVAPGEIVLRGELANRYIGMDNNGNLIAYVSDHLAPVAYPLDKSLSSGYVLGKRIALSTGQTGQRFVH